MAGGSQPSGHRIGCWLDQSNHALHRGVHETVYRDSTLENELIEAEEIAEGVAVVQFWSRLTAGAAHPAGPHQVDTLFERAGSWRIKAAENVTLTNPRTGEPVLRG